jgi:hypothetical protein
MEIAAMKRANLDTHNILATKTTPAQTMNDRRTTAYFNAMNKPSEKMFDGTPENWSAFGTPPPTRSLKSNHKLEPRHHKLSTHGWKLRTIQLPPMIL